MRGFTRRMVTAKARRRLRVVAGFVVAIAVLVALLSAVGLDAVAAELRTLDYPLFGLAVLSGVVALGIRLVALSWLFEGVPGALRGRSFTAAYLSSVFVKGVLPWGRAGGSAVTAFVLTRHSRNRFEQNFAVVMLFDLLGLVASVTVVAGGLAYLTLTRTSADWGLELAATLAATAGVFVILASLVVRREEYVARAALLAARALRATLGRASWRLREGLEQGAVERRLGRFFETVRATTGNRRAVLTTLALAHVGWVAAIAPLYFGLLAVGAYVPFPVLMFVVPVAGVGGSVPLPGGLGGVELALSGLLVAFTGVGVGTVAAGVLLYRLSTYWLYLALGATGTAYLTVERSPTPAN